MDALEKKKILPLGLEILFFFFFFFILMIKNIRHKMSQTYTYIFNTYMHIEENEEKNCYYNLFDCQLLKRKNAKPHEFKMTFPHNKSGFILF